MRNLLSILLLIGVCIACSNDDENPFEFTGSATALKNNENWKSGLRAAKNLPYDIGIDLSFTVLNNEGIQRENLGIVRLRPTLDLQKVYLTLINNQIKNDSVAVFYSTLIDDGDVLGDIYGIDTTYSDNYIQLTSIDKKKCRIAGLFNLRLVLTRDDNDGPPPPVILEFTNGYFESSVKPEWLE